MSFGLIFFVYDEIHDCVVYLSGFDIITSFMSYPNANPIFMKLIKYVMERKMVNIVMKRWAKCQRHIFVSQQIFSECEKNSSRVITFVLVYIGCNVSICLLNGE